MAAFTKASWNESPAARKRFTPCRSTSVELMTTPQAATIPNTNGTESPRCAPRSPMKAVPHTAPTNANGSTAMMMKGCEYDRRGMAKRA